MEELNRNQFILLVLLISFVTSIATGIVTVTLMDQASPGVTQTINRVVERTIERVVPGETETTTVVREVPVIVTEEEMITAAFNKVSGSVFRLAKRVDDGWQGIGSVVLLTADGQLATKAGLLIDDEESEALDQSYSIVIEGQDRFPVEVTATTADNSLALLEVTADQKKYLEIIANIDLPILASNAVTVGQTVIGVGAVGGGNHTASVGIVSQLTDDGRSIRTNAASSDNLGGPLLNIQGELIGINILAGRARINTQLIDLLTD